ncbi:Uncharacterised protein [Mycobacteroides abscessus subsp. abscessus]|nr:Uncharacterised protein [Mycobacteroides abscessus subsp. abscessus]
MPVLEYAAALLIVRIDDQPACRVRPAVASGGTGIDHRARLHGVHRTATGTADEPEVCPGVHAAVAGAER